MSVLGSIGYELNKYIEATIGEEAVHDLAGEFLGTSYEASNPLFDAIDAVVHNEPLFRSWLWFDYLYEDKSMIEHFANSQPRLDPDTVQELDNMVRTVYFGIFEVGKVKPGNIELTDQRTGTTYHIREYSLASQIKTRQIMSARICLQAGHWEIIMPDNAIMPLTIDSPEILEAMKSELPDRITICNTFGYERLRSELGLKDKDQMSFEPPKQKVSVKDAGLALQREMERAGLTRYISLKSITDIFKNEHKSKVDSLSPPLGIRILFGLADQEKTDITALLNASNTYWNSLVTSNKLKKLGSRHRLDIHIDKYDPNAWRNYAEEAHDFLVANKPADSVRSFNKIFEMLLQQQTITASVYRIVTNAGVAHLANGNLVLGERLIDEALRLCPTYDFALKQQNLIDNGHYAFESIRQVAENSELFTNLRLPDPETIRNLKDAELIKQFENKGATLDPASFVKLALLHHDQTKIVEDLKVDKGDFDYVYLLVTEARERWAPEVVWVDTIHELTYRLDDVMYPTGFTSLRAGKIHDTVKSVAQLLSEALERADKQVIDSWMMGSQEYSNDRQNIVYYTEDTLKKPISHATLLALCAVARERTKDPIYTTPTVLKQIRTLTDDNTKQARHLIKEQSKALILDHSSMQIIGDCLAQTHPKLACLAFEYGISALHARVKKQLWDNSPYDSEPIAEHIDYLYENLAELYEQLGETKAIDRLATDYEKLISNGRIFRNPSNANSIDFNKEIDSVTFANDPILGYLHWFYTLKIDLSYGDGQFTELTSSGDGKKIGRNDPCPCGSTKKFKKCHGSI